MNVHPLLERLLDDCGYPEVNLANHDDFVGSAGMNVLFFPGDPEVVRDSTDVAVVLPELVAHFAGRMRPGIVLDTFGDGKALRQRYGFREFPALVFVRNGEYVGAITRIQDWAEYIAQVSGLLTAPPRRAPGFSIPVVSA